MLGDTDVVSGSSGGGKAGTSSRGVPGHSMPPKLLTSSSVKPLSERDDAPDDDDDDDAHFRGSLTDTVVGAAPGSSGVVGGLLA
tara:strand:- start:596 stop:847 length:252 start_codon:yes stop_codon:yes gene_type:complete